MVAGNKGISYMGLMLKGMASGLGNILNGAGR